jgi:hypothetical protein
MIRTTFKVLGTMVLALVVLVAAALMWASSRLSKDDPNIQRPTYSSYEMGAGAADGSVKPSPTGYVVDSAGRSRILPPMPPEKAMDIHTAANYKKNLTLRSCFWPGPRARGGVFTNDANSFSFENQFPDTATTYIPTALSLPEGAKLVIQGDFPHMRHWNFNIYNPRGEPQDGLNDTEIEPDAGSFNPFRPGTPRDVTLRRYTFTIVNGKPASPRPANTLYTNTDAGKEVYLWMRNYVPDHSVDYLGGVALPDVALHLADGKVLTQEASCEASNSPMRGKQLPMSVDPRAWILLSRMPWIDTANVGAKNVEAAPFKVFFNRKQLITELFFPALSSANPEQIGGWWSNYATRYGYSILSRNLGKVYVMTAKLPATPKTWHGEAENTPNTDMRYTSICTAGALTSAMTPDCLYDEQLANSVDSAGRYAVVLSRQEDRPKNATVACGVAWLDIGNGDGMTSGSTEYAMVINRHTMVDQNFKHSWFAVQKPGTEKEAMGEYLPYLVNMHEKERFEALGCPVDRSAILAMLPK